jgi:hypothetical protein
MSRCCVFLELPQRKNEAVGTIGRMGQLSGLASRRKMSDKVK